MGTTATPNSFKYFRGIQESPHRIDERAKIGTALLDHYIVLIIDCEVKARQTASLLGRSLSFTFTTLATEEAES